MRYVIVCNDLEMTDGQKAYWTCHFNDTENLTTDKQDATTFASKSAAYALMGTLGMKDDHHLEEWE